MFSENCIFCNKKLLYTPLVFYCNCVNRLYMEYGRDRNCDYISFRIANNKYMVCLYPHYPKIVIYNPKAGELFRDEENPITWQFELNDDSKIKQQIETLLSFQ